MAEIRCPALEGQLFRVQRREAALFVPPCPWRFALRGAAMWDRIGRRFSRRLAGVILIEAEKDLFAAIPAVVAYNRFTHDIDRLAIRFESFVEEFSNILQRQSR